MNNLKKLLLLVAISVTSIAFSQDGGPSKRSVATVTGNFCVVLDNAKPVQEYYVADATNLNWTSAEQATKLCGFHSNNLVSYVADFASKKLYIHVYLDRTNGAKDLEWWNAYLLSLCH
jgi:hypothetical protein